MLKKIQAFFAAEESNDVDDEAALHLAAAVLLIEVAKSDHSLRRRGDRTPQGRAET